MVAAVVGILKFGLAIGLVVAWGFVLVPPLLRMVGGVSRGRAGDSIGSFRDKMSLLGGTPVRPAASFDLTTRSADLGAGTARRQRQALKQRRRNILVGLLGAAGITLLPALLVGGIAWAAFGVTAIALAAYVALLWQAQQVALERRGKVAYLPQQDRAVPNDGAQLRRVATRSS